MKEIEKELLLKQLNLENKMIEIGIAKYDQACIDGEVSEVAHGSQAIDRYLKGMIVAVDERRDRKTTGHRPAVFVLAKEVSSETLAFSTLRAIVNSTVKPDFSVSALLVMIGDYVEDAINLIELDKKMETEGDFVGEYRQLKYLQANIDKHGYRSIDQKRSLVRQHVELTGKQKGLIGKVLFGLFTDTYPEALEMDKVWSGAKQCTNFVVPSKQLSDWMEKNRDFAAESSVNYLPMLCPPLDWDNPIPQPVATNEDFTEVFSGSGGYLTQKIQRTYNLVKKSSDKKTVEVHGENPDYQNDYAALNAVQRTPFRINQKVVEVVRHMVDNKVTVKGLASSKYDNEKPEDYPFGNEYREKGTMPKELIPEFQKHIERKSVLAEQKKSAKSKRQANLLTLAIAEMEEYKDVDLFFAWNLDYRSRKYALSSFLSPQGTDLSKAMLDFSTGSKINTPTKIRDFQICGATLWDEAISDTDSTKTTRVSLDDRVKWVSDNHGLILGSARDPLFNTFWQGAGEPFQFLRFCFTYAEWVDKGFEAICYMPIPLDASCSGLQIYSMLLRDREGAESTNLVDCVVPRDIYTDVAKVMEQLLQNGGFSETGPPVFDEGKEPEFLEQKCRWVLDNVAIVRGVTKRGTMTRVYAVKKQTLAKYIRTDYLEVAYPFDGDNPLPLCSDDGAFNTQKDLALFLKDFLWAAINEVVKSAQFGMEFLQNLAAAANEEGQGFHLTTPTGFKLPLNKMKTKPVRITEVLFNGKSITARLRLPSNDLDKAGQKSSVGANVVHSLDAAIVVFAVIKAVEAGILDFALIHDSFATTLDNTEDFARIVREAMVEVFTPDILSGFRDQFIEQFPNSEEIPDRLELSDFDLKEILTARFTIL